MFYSIKKWLLKPVVSVAIVEAVLAFALYAFDPLGFASQKTLSLDHLLSWFSQYRYESKGVDTVAVVLIDEPTLKQWGMDWPITYQQTGSLINRLSCAGATGVFFDYTLTRSFNLSGGSEQLLQTAEHPAASGPCMTGKPSDIPIYFSKIRGVGSPLFGDLDARHRMFLIDAAGSDDIYPVNEIAPADGPVAIEDMSPAFGIMRERCRAQRNSNLACPESLRANFPFRPLALTWGGDANPKQSAVSGVGRCRGRLSWWEMVPTFLGLTGENYTQICRPILTLSARDLYRDYNYIQAHGDPSTTLAGRMVFVGTELGGLNDEISSPVHGTLPGVYQHAVAFDNLLTFGVSYPTIPAKPTELFLIGCYYMLIELLTVLARGRLTLRSAEIDSRLAALVSITLLYGILFGLNHWPFSILIMAISYYFGADLISTFTQSAQGRKMRMHRSRARRR